VVGGADQVVFACGCGHPVELVGRLAGGFSRSERKCCSRECVGGMNAFECDSGG